MGATRLLCWLAGWLAHVSITCSCPVGLAHRRIAPLPLVLPGKPSLVSDDPVQSKKSREGGKGDCYPEVRVVRGGMGRRGPAAAPSGLTGSDGVTQVADQTWQT